MVEWKISPGNANIHWEKEPGKGGINAKIRNRYRF
jgi:hypothetical protein